MKAPAVLALVAAWTILAAVPVLGQDAPAILAAPRQRIETADFTAVGRLVRVDSSGARTSYGLSIKAHEFPGVLRVLVEVNSPAAARTHLLLEMRTHGQSTIEVAHPGDAAPTSLPFDQWKDGPLGPGFSYEDFLEQQYFWPEQTVDAPVKYGARDCDVISSQPGTEQRTHYAGVKTWLDHTIGFPVFAQKTLKGSGAVKEFTYIGIRHDQGVWSASQVEEKTRGQDGETLLIIDRGNAKANLGLKDFSTAKLVQF
jgi:hypothetical protein